jgi:predicted adenylyl cyclase CyaB
MVEIKARVENHDLLKKKLSEIGAEYIGNFQQDDTYFKVPEGRLKLRETKNTNSVELIYYERENIPGPKQDEVFLIEVLESGQLKKLLKKTLKQFKVIEKIREIYNYQGTFIHLDTVKSLGKYVEFERQTESNSNNKKDQNILQELMKTLEIQSQSLETLSYSEIAD